jgi:hypothetical protein
LNLQNKKKSKSSNRNLQNKKKSKVFFRTYKIKKSSLPPGTYKIKKIQVFQPEPTK